MSPIQNLHGYWLSLRDIQTRRAAIEDLLASGGDGSIFEFQVTEFDGVLPIVGCGAYGCEVDFAHRGSWDRLQERNGQVPLLMHALVPVAGRTVHVMGWLRDGFQERYREVASSIQSIPIQRVATAVCRFTIDICESFFVNPSWYDSLSKLEKLHLDANMHMIADVPHGPGCVFDSINLTIPCAVRRLHRSWGSGK